MYNTQYIYILFIGVYIIYIVNNNNIFNNYNIYNKIYNNKCVNIYINNLYITISN